jgi:diguanylate cyclase (GGDEF)-like protein/PAS domain S-box-containing protein
MPTRDGILENEQDDSKLVLRIQNAMDVLPSPIFIKDKDGRYIACNRAFEDYIGLPRARVLGASVYDVAPPELAAIYERADRELMQQGGTQTYETNVRYADGTYHDVMFFKSVFCDDKGDAEGISGVIFDITERKRLEQELAQAAREDFLTGTLNLRTFYELANQEFARHKRHQGDNFSLLLLDLDRFKEINDTMGHEAGDEALRVFVKAVKANLREQDIFARTGGDEFRILLPGTSLTGAAQFAERIRADVARTRVSTAKGAVNLSMSAGMSGSRAQDRDVDDVVRRADSALYEAKAAGRNCVRVNA